MNYLAGSTYKSAKIYGPAVNSVVILFLLVMSYLPTDAQAQLSVPCCGEWIVTNPEGAGHFHDWDCGKGMKEGSETFRASMCKQLRDKGKLCPEIAPYCSEPPIDQQEKCDDMSASNAKCPTDCDAVEEECQSSCYALQEMGDSDSVAGNDRNLSKRDVYELFSSCRICNDCRRESTARRNECVDLFRECMSPPGASWTLKPGEYLDQCLPENIQEAVKTGNFENKGILPTDIADAVLGCLLGPGAQLSGTYLGCNQAFISCFESDPYTSCRCSSSSEYEVLGPIPPDLQPATTPTPNETK